MINYCQALNLFKEIGNENGVGICSNNIGNIHLKNKRYIEAIERYEISLEIINSEINEYMNQNQDNFSPRIMLSDENFRKTIKSRADRASQLAKAMLRKFQSKKISNINESTSEEIEKIITLLNSANENYHELTLLISKIILNKIDISLAYLLKLDISSSKNNIEEAEALLKDFKKKELSLSLIPKEVLVQKILVQKGLIEKEIGNMKKAAEYFTESIETIQEYDPATKKQ